MATWIYLLPSGVSGRGPIASQFHSEKINGAGVCSVIRIVLFFIALSAFVQVLHVLTNFCTSEVRNFQLYALCYGVLLTHFLEFLSCVGCPIISLNTAGENHAGIQHS